MHLPQSEKALVEHYLYATAASAVAIYQTGNHHLKHVLWAAVIGVVGPILARFNTKGVVADLSKTIAENYGVLAGEYDIDEDGKSVFNGAPVAYRGLFLIDKNGVVRHQLVNDLPLGRSVDEALRTLDALRHFEEYGEVCPANWQEGKEAMSATAEGVADYLSKH